MFVRPRSLILVCACVPPFAALGADSAAQVTWDGSCGGDSWTATCPGGQTNWNRNIPTQTDDVSIPMGSPIVQLHQDGFANEITVDSGLRIGNAALRLGAGGFISNLNMDATFARILFVNPGIELGIQSNIHWGVGTVSGDGVIYNLGGTVNNTIDAQAMTMNLEDSATFRNESGGAVTLRFLSINTGSEFKNEAGATFTAHADAISGYIHNGVFTNAGTFVVNHATSSPKEITAYINMTGGTFTVKGVPHTLGTYLNSGGNFTGGTISVLDDCNLRFIGASGPQYVFNGLTSISGPGNAYVEIGPFAGLDWQVLSPLSVNLTGTNGFVIGGNRLTLFEPLTNSGKAKWISGTIRGETCEGCTPIFHNVSTEFTINGSPALGTIFWNAAGARIDHTGGTLTITPSAADANDAFMLNDGEYRLIAGNIQQGLSGNAFATTSGGTFRKPDLAQTTDSSISCTFSVGNESSLLLEKAVTTFSGGGLHLDGCTMQVSDGATAALTLGTHTSTSVYPVTVSGAGRLIVNALGTWLVNPVGESGTFTIEMTGTNPNGFHLASQGVFGGGSELKHAKVKGNFYWSGGTLGSQGDGWLENQGEAQITSGTISGANARFVNAKNVDQTGSLSLSNGGGAINTDDWDVLLPGGNSTTFSGNGTLENAATGEITVSAPVPPSSTSWTSPVSNLGIVRVRPGVTLNLSNVVGLTNGVLGQGAWVAEAGGIIDFPINVTEIGGNAQVVGSTASFPGVTPTLVRGKLKATGPVNPNNHMRNKGRTSSAPGPVQNPTKDVNNGGSGQLTVAYAFADHTLDPMQPGVTGGYVCANFNNEEGGVIQPGGPDAPGPFDITGNLNLTSGGVVQVELEGTTPVNGHDQIRITGGNVSLGGMLEVKLRPGYAPARGTPHTILTASGGTISGTFNQTTGNAAYTVTYNPTSVVVTINGPICEADLAPAGGGGDGVVGIADLLAAIGAWGTCPDVCEAPSQAFACPYDVNHDCVVGIGDLLAVIGAWGGCD